MTYDDADDQRRPGIGICAAVADAHWGAWHERAALLSVRYIKHIQRAGGLAMMLPPDPGLESRPDEILDLIDGLILAGGSDVDPSAYGAERHPETGHTVPERDRAELALARRAVERDMPVLGICRGMQVMNVAFGGTLTQHLPDQVGHERHRPRPGSFENSDHTVRLAEGSLAAMAAGELVHNIKTHHHQGIQQLANRFAVTGYSTLDEIPEAIEAPDRRFALGVQWHPEADEQSRVIGTLVDEARAYRGMRVSA